MPERPGTVASSRRSKRDQGGPFYLVGGAIIAAIFVVPLVWEILRSFEAPAAIVSPPSLKYFSHLSVSNYTKLLNGDNILRNVINSLIVAVATAAVTAFVATLAGYGFGRFKFRAQGPFSGSSCLGSWCRSRLSSSRCSSSSKCSTC